MAQVAPANAEPKEKPVRGLELVASTSMAAALATALASARVPPGPGVGKRANDAGRV